MSVLYSSCHFSATAAITHGCTCAGGSQASDDRGDRSKAGAGGTSEYCDGCEGGEEFWEVRVLINLLCIH